MLLVLVSVFAATILATAYLVSRDTSSAIGDNISASASARWAAVSALETAVAAMETETDWRSAAADGTLFSNLALAGATVDVQVSDVITGSPPTADSNYLELTSSATVGGVTQVARAAAYAPTEPGITVDVDLSEFAIFSSGSILLEDNAVLTRWTTAPLTPLGHRVNLATRATGASSVVIGADATALDVAVYHGPGASGALVSNGTGQPIQQVELPDPPPMPDPPGPDVAAPSGSSNYTLSNGEDTIAADLEVDTFSLKNGAQATLLGDITVVCDNNVELSNASKLLIDGSVKLVAFNDIELLSGSSIELKPGATLTVFCGDDLELTDSYIGDERPDNTRDSSGSAPYMDPLRIQVFTIESTSEDRTFELWGDAVVKGSFFGPSARFEARTDCALYGRLAAKRVEVTSNGAIFYDHSLDGRRGFANPSSPLYVGGAIQNEILTLASLDPADLTATANGLNLLLRAGGQLYGDTLPSDPGPPGPGDPTPRVMAVEYDLVSFGIDMRQWEQGE
jgi:hypothetical protein